MYFKQRDPSKNSDVTTGLSFHFGPQFPLHDNFFLALEIYGKERIRGNWEERVRVNNKERRNHPRDMIMNQWLDSQLVNGMDTYKNKDCLGWH